MVFLRMVMAASIVGASAFGCDEDDGELFGDSTRLYFHNQMTQTTGGSSSDVNVDLFVDDLGSPLVDDRGYTEAGSVSSDTIELDDDSETIAFDVLGSASGSSLISGPINKTLVAGSDYTVVLMGDTTLGNQQLEIFRYQDVDVASGQIRVRFINTLSRLSGDEISVSLPGGGEAIASGLEYSEGSSYVSLSSGSTLQVEVNNQTQALLIDTVSCPVSTGRSYDAIIAYSRFDSDDDQISIYCQPYN